MAEHPRDLGTSPGCRTPRPVPSRRLAGSPAPGKPWRAAPAGTALWVPLPPESGGAPGTELRLRRDTNRAASGASGLGEGGRAGTALSLHPLIPGSIPIPLHPSLYPYIAISIPGSLPSLTAPLPPPPLPPPQSRPSRRTHRPLAARPLTSHAAANRRAGRLRASAAGCGRGGARRRVRERPVGGALPLLPPPPLLPLFPLFIIFLLFILFLPGVPGSGEQRGRAQPGTGLGGGSWRWKRGREGCGPLSP